jgi:hypothetical protein
LTDTGTPQIKRIGVGAWWKLIKGEKMTPAELDVLITIMCKAFFIVACIKYFTEKR